MKLFKFQNRTTINNETDLNTLFLGVKIICDEPFELILSGEIFIDSYIKFSGNCEIRDGVKIAFGSQISNSVIKENTNIRPNSIIENSIIGENCIIGPGAYIRGNSSIGNRSIIGSNVEITRTSTKENIKVSHFAFIGDANIFENVIVGAGVVFSNYFNGKRENIKINKDSFVGSNSTLIAPLIVGERVLIAAGSVITKNVKNDSKIIQKRASV